MSNLDVIIKALGLEPFEEFILSKTNQKYRFTDKELQFFNTADWETSDLRVNFLVQSTITRIPFEPTFGKAYWAVSIIAGFPTVTEFIWQSSNIDFAYKKLGLIHRTKKRAEECLKEDYKKLTNEDLEEE